MSLYNLLASFFELAETGSWILTQDSHACLQPFYICPQPARMYFTPWNGSCFYERRKCCSFRDLMTSKALGPRSIENRSCLDLYFLQLLEDRRKETVHTITDFTLSLQITNVIFLKVCSEIRRICEKDMFPTRSPDNVTQSHFRHYCTDCLSHC